MADEPPPTNVVCVELVGDYEPSSPGSDSQFDGSCAELSQGSPDWKAARVEPLNASSDFSAALDLNSYTSRTAALKEKQANYVSVVGRGESYVDKPAGPYLQRMFDMGHAVEPIALGLVSGLMGGAPVLEFGQGRRHYDRFTLAGSPDGLFYTGNNGGCLAGLEIKTVTRWRRRLGPRINHLLQCHAYTQIFNVDAWVLFYYTSIDGRPRWEAYLIRRDPDLVTTKMYRALADYAYTARNAHVKRRSVICHVELGCERIKSFNGSPDPDKWTIQSRVTLYDRTGMAKTRANRHLGYCTSCTRLTRDKAVVEE